MFQCKKKTQIPVKKQSSSSKKSPSMDFEHEIFIESLKFVISKLILQCPKEIHIEIFNFLDKLFLEMKDMFMLHYAEKHSAESRKKIWDNIINKYQIICQPLYHIVSHSNEEMVIPVNPIANEPKVLNHAIKAYQSAQLSRDWPNPFDFLDLLEPNDIATICGKIGDLLISYAILDTGADSVMITDNVIKHLGEKIDKKKVYNITGALGNSKSIGTAYNIPITIDNGKDSIIVYEEVTVLPTQKDRNGKDLSIVILGTNWQHHVGWHPIVKGEFTATRNGKTITIPISTRKENHKANIANTLSKQKPVVEKKN